MYPKIKIHRNVYLDVFRSILKRVNIAALHVEKGFKIDQKINFLKSPFKMSAPSNVNSFQNGKILIQTRSPLGSFKLQIKICVSKQP